MKLLTSEALSTEAWPETNRYLSRDYVVPLLERVRNSQQAYEGEHKWQVAQYFCTFAEAFIAAALDRLDEDSAREHGEGVSESDEFMDSFLDLMVAHPDITNAQLAEHVVVERFLHVVADIEYK